MDWATGLVDALAVTPVRDTQSRNHYNWESAREAQYRALTSRRDHNSNGVYEPSDAQADNEERLDMWSLFDTAFSVDLYNHTVMADVLLPRAIGYSVGLINYFFRGQLSVTSPPGGLFGVLDQGTTHHVDADGYPRLTDNSIFGFTTLRARVRNDTTAITESGTGTSVPQALHGGSVVAVARYHRNPCYRTDLSGEYLRRPDNTLFVPAGCTFAQMRTAYQEISVLAPLGVDVGGNLSGISEGSNACANVGNLNSGATGVCANASALLEFNFGADPIPINATDLFLQVVYRGPLGEEMDGIALGTMDIAEPNYVSNWNNTDWFLYNGNWLLPADVPSGAFDPTPVTTTDLNLCYDDQLIAANDTGQVLNPGAEFIRIAVLTDLQLHSFAGVEISGGLTVYSRHSTRTATLRQSHQENGGSFAPDSMLYGRGITVGLDYSANAGYYPTTTTAVSILTLSSITGGARGPGLATPGLVQYTNTAQNPCAQIH